MLMICFGHTIPNYDPNYPVLAKITTCYNFLTKEGCVCVEGGRWEKVGISSFSFTFFFFFFSPCPLFFFPHPPHVGQKNKSKKRGNKKDIAQTSLMKFFPSRKIKNQTYEHANR
eukprot:TRINITY_DN5543_c1_g1_i1.p1 TRINITY_DN5543_c1_g1~~TRINITY_DN5543_c1_g1_i1.p1  ORF type:complete len:114 (-),score=1.84 TRINITY_DN5543_c1_g1_i1:143-484(-)